MKPYGAASSIVREFEEFCARREPLIKYIRKPEEVSLVGMYVIRSYAMHGARSQKLQDIINRVLECKSPLYRNELWNTYLMCLCESAEMIDKTHIAVLHEQMDFYCIESNATTFTYLIALYLQAGQDPSALYADMLAKGITPSNAMFKSILQSLARSFPENDLLAEVFTFFLSHTPVDDEAPFSVQRIGLWMLWTAKDSSLSPSLLPLLFQFLLRRIEALSEDDRKHLCSVDKAATDAEVDKNTSKDALTTIDVLKVVVKPQLMRHIERHCLWFRDITSYDAIYALLPEEYQKHVLSVKEHVFMVCALFSKGSIERGMQSLAETPWEYSIDDAVPEGEKRSKLSNEKMERNIESLAAELRTTSAVDRAFYAVEEMHRKGVKVSINTLNMIILACNLQGDDVRAYETAEAIQSFNLSPNEMTFKFLLRLSGPFQMRPDQVSAVLQTMESLRIPLTPAIVHLAVLQLVWHDFITEAMELVARSIQSAAIAEKTVMHVVRRLIYIGDMYSAAELVVLTLDGPLKETFPTHFVKFVALRTQDERLQVVRK